MEWLVFGFFSLWWYKNIKNFVKINGDMVKYVGIFGFLRKFILIFNLENVEFE